eukprot:3041839-Pyramimonas_sp.AAC.1
MLLPRLVQRSVAPEGAPPTVPMEQFACVSSVQYSVAWPQRELHRRSQWRSSHASPPPSTAFRGPTGSSTE